MLPEFISNPNPEIYLGNNYVCLDFETTNIDKGSALTKGNSLLLACWCLGPDHSAKERDGRDHYHFGGEYSQVQLLAHISSASFVVAHNLKFEYQWLKRCGAELRDLLGFDTQIGQFVINGNRKTSLRLDDVAPLYGLGGKYSFVSRLIKGGCCPSTIPKQWLLDYCQRDVQLCEEVFRSQRSVLKSSGLLPVTYCRNLLTPCLADMEEPGMSLDAARVAETYTEYKGRYDVLSDEFAALTGGINPKSPKQMREFLYEKMKFAEVTDYKGNPILTDSGQKSTDKNILSQLTATTPEQKIFKKCAHALATLKTPMQNLTKMMAIAATGENVHAKFNQTVVRSHRLSSSGAKGGFQFHNFDRAFKRLFRARDGYAYVEGDAPQLEFRAAGHLTGDPVIRSSVLAGEDVHALSASVLGVSRQAAKKDTFKPLYGGQSGTPKEKRYYEAFRAKYKKCYDTQKAWTYEVAQTGKLRIASGLIFYWPDTKIKDGGYVTNTPSIFNYPIQSFATADIIPLTLVLLWHRTRSLDVRLVNTIHDSIVAEVILKHLDKYVEELVYSFTSGIYTLLEKLYGISFQIPLGVGVKHSQHWGEGPEQKYEPMG